MAACAVGLGKEVRQILTAADTVTRDYVTLKRRARARNVCDPTSNLRGPCGTWVVAASKEILKRYTPKNPRIDIDSYIIQKYAQAAGNDCQNSIRLAFMGANGQLVEYFLDDGEVGGEGGVFSRAEADAYMNSKPKDHPEKGNQPRESNTSIDSCLGDGITHKGHGDWECQK